MDIRCPKCSEPWDIDTIHEAASEQGRTFDEVRADFYAKGCEAFGWSGPCAVTDRPKSDVASAIYDLMGDDIDGAASAFEDAEAMGLI